MTAFIARRSNPQPRSGGFGLVRIRSGAGGGATRSARRFGGGLAGPGTFAVGFVAGGFRTPGALTACGRLVPPWAVASRSVARRLVAPGPIAARSVARRLVAPGSIAARPLA